MKTWTATRFGMRCPISTADLLAKIDAGAEQVNENTFLWDGWVIRADPPKAPSQSESR